MSAMVGGSLFHFTAKIGVPRNLSPFFWELLLNNYEHTPHYFSGHLKIDFLLLGWYKSNCSFCLVELCHVILEYILKQICLSSGP